MCRMMSARVRVLVALVEGLVFRLIESSGVFELVVVLVGERRVVRLFRG